MTTSDLYQPALAALPDSAVDLTTALLRALRPADPAVNRWLLAELAIRGSVDVQDAGYVLACTWAERHQAGKPDDDTALAALRLIGRRDDWIAAQTFVKAMAEINLQRFKDQGEQPIA